MKSRSRVMTAGIGFCLAALLLRLYGIEFQSLWSDEGNSISLARRSLAQIVKETARDIHPPVYFWTLHFWVGLFGQSPLAVRSLSAVYGALLVGLTYVLGIHWFGARAAIIAA